MIKAVFVFQNGMHAVCDDKGRQIPQLQKPDSKTRNLVLELVLKNPSIEVYV
jgi:hypothetical protein